MIKITNKKNKSWVTFTVDASAGESVLISGEWNDWKKEPMKVKKNGEFYITKVMKSDNTYQFGYLVDGERWIVENNMTQVPSPFNSNNTLLEL